MLKRLAFISYHTCPLSDEKDAEIGGLNTYVWELAKALSEKGYVIDIYTRCVDKNSCNIVSVNPNLRVIHLKAGKAANVPKIELLQLIPEFSSTLYNFIKQEKLSYDLISTHYYLSGLIGLEIKKKLKIPLTITFHTLALMKNLVAKNGEDKESFDRIKAELLLVRNADFVIANSEADFDYLHTLYDCPVNKLVILGPGVDFKIFKPIDKTKAKEIAHANLKHKIVLYAGRIEPLKNIDVLIYAIKILKHRHPKLPICLWVVGGNTKSEEKQNLEQIRKVLNIRSSVRFIGQKKRAELPYYFNSAELVLMPSQYESFGITALEAMACGIPVITTDTTGVSRLLDKEHRTLLTSANNPLAMARKIYHLLTNQEEYNKISKRVYKKVQDLSWSKTAERFTKLIIS